MAYLREYHHPSWIILTDLANAYDTVHRPFLYKALIKKNLPAGLIRWIRILLEGSTARVIINGRPTATFEVRRGLPQGSGLAPLLFLSSLIPSSWTTLQMGMTTLSTSSGGVKVISGPCVILISMSKPQDKGSEAKTSARVGTTSSLWQILQELGNFLIWGKRCRKHYT